LNAVGVDRRLRKRWWCIYKTLTIKKVNIVDVRF